MKLLGIDTGTGGTRAVVINEAGSVVASATCEHEPFASPQPAWAEQDPLDWWRACTVAVRAVLSQSAVDAAEIAAVGLTGQMHGAVLLDQSGDVIRPALVCGEPLARRRRPNEVERIAVDRPFRSVGWIASCRV